MATQVTSLYGLLELRANKFFSGLNKAETRVKGFGGAMGRLGGALGGVGAQLGGLGRLAGVGTLGFGALIAGGVKAAADFDTAMTNVNSLMQLGADEAAALGDQIRDLGGDSIHGPQATAEAFYNVVSGVQDASTHMAVLQAAMDTAAGSQADLTATTAVMVGAVNAYGFEADKARFVSDVLTRSVAKGVLTMDELATALPTVTSMGAEMGVSFEELAGSLSIITQSGASASRAGTWLAGVLKEMQKPSTGLAKALDEMGYASGRALLEEKGLVAGLNLLKDHLGIMDDAIGSQEAMQGVLALTKDGTQALYDEFVKYIDGSTGRAKAVQDETAGFELLKQKLASIYLEVSGPLFLFLEGVADSLKDGIDQVKTWAEEHPKAAKIVVDALKIAAATIIGAKVIGAIIAAFTKLAAVAGVAWTAVAGPVGLAVAGGVAGAALTLGVVVPEALKITAGLTSPGKPLAHEQHILRNIMNPDVVGEDFLSREQFESVAWGIQQQRRDTGSGIDFIDEGFNRFTFGSMRMQDMYNEYERLFLARLNGQEVDWQNLAAAAPPQRSGLRYVPGFSAGGFTGSGPASEIAGMVHRGEFVVPRDGALVLRDERAAGITININAPLTVQANDPREFGRRLMEAGMAI